MGVIQSSVNQLLSVGAILSRASEPLQNRAAAISKEKAAVADISQKESEISTLSGQQKKDEASIKRLQKKISKEEEELKGELGDDRERRAARFEANIQKLFGKERIGAEGAQDISKRELELAKKKYELDKSEENLLAVRKAEGKLSEATSGLKRTLQKQKEREKELSRVEYYKKQAMDSLRERRMELGDQFYFDGQKITEEQYPELYNRISEQIKKEG